ncbi:MAG: hypothetical protein WB797_10410 [Nocardioides sp.]
MRRVLGLILPILALVLVTGCHVKVPGVRQAANPCHALGRARLAHLAHARGTVSQKPMAVFTQAQACEFKAAGGTPVIILGTWDASHLSFGSEVSKLEGQFHGTAVRQVKLPGAAQAASMRGTFDTVQLPVLLASHDGFISVVIVVTRVAARAPVLERNTMKALVHAAG